MEQLIYNDPILNEMIFTHAREHRIIVLNDEIDRDSIFKAKYYIERLVRLDNGNPQPITIRINSYGGEALSTMFLVSYIEELKEQGYEIICEVEAFAMSGGFLILISGSKRVAHRYSEIMWHQPNSYQVGHYTLKDKKLEYEQTQKLWNTLKDYVVSRTNITHEEMDKSVTVNEDWFMTAQDAVKLGVIDTIL